MNSKIVYINSTVEFHIFILVRMPLKFINEGLSGSAWSMFKFLSGLMKSLFLLFTWCSQSIFQKIKKCCFIISTLFLNWLNLCPAIWQYKVFVSQTDYAKLTGCFVILCCTCHCTITGGSEFLSTYFGTFSIVLGRTCII